MTSEKPYWFALADADQSTPRPRRAKRNFPVLAVASLGVVVLSGSLVINTSDEPVASASNSKVTTSQPITASQVTDVSAKGSINKVSSKTSKAALVTPVVQTNSTKAQSNRRSEEGEHEGGENDD